MIPDIKVYEYRCGHKYLTTFMGRSSGRRLCPECKQPIYQIIKPCKHCGKTLYLSSLRGKVSQCEECRLARDRKLDREGAPIRRTMAEIREAETPEIKKTRSRRWLYRVMENDLLAFPSTPAIDKLCEEV